MNNGTLVLAKWIMHGGRASTFGTTRRSIGDTDIMTYLEARNLRTVGLVKIVGEAEDVIEKVGSTLDEEEDNYGSVPSDDPLSPCEG